MRKADANYRISGNSIVEIQHGLQEEARRLYDLGMRQTEERREWLKGGHVLNYWAAYVLSLEPAERHRIALEGFRIYNERLASNKPEYFDISGCEDPSCPTCPPDVTRSESHGRPDEGSSKRRSKGA